MLESSPIAADERGWRKTLAAARDGIGGKEDFRGSKKEEYGEEIMVAMVLKGGNFNILASPLKRNTLSLSLIK